LGSQQEGRKHHKTEKKEVSGKEKGCQGRDKTTAGSHCHCHWRWQQEFCCLAQKNWQEARKCQKVGGKGQSIRKEKIKKKGKREEVTREVKNDCRKPNVGNGGSSKNFIVLQKKSKGREEVLENWQERSKHREGKKILKRERSKGRGHEGSEKTTTGTTNIGAGGSSTNFVVLQKTLKGREEASESQWEGSKHPKGKKNFKR